MPCFLTSRVSVGKSSKSPRIGPNNNPIDKIESSVRVLTTLLNSHHPMFWCPLCWTCTDLKEDMEARPGVEDFGEPKSESEEGIATEADIEQEGLLLGTWRATLPSSSACLWKRWR